MISEQDKKWILAKLKSVYKNEDVTWEYELMEHGIKLSSPSNVRVYVEQKLKQENWFHRLQKILTRIDRSTATDQSRFDEIEKELRKIEEEIKTDDPEYFKRVAVKMISQSLATLYFKRHGENMRVEVR